MIDSQIDDMIKENLTIKRQIDSLEQNLSNQIKENEPLLQTFTVFKNESKVKESKYVDKEIDLEKKIKELDNFVYKVGQSAQTVHMLTKPQVFYDDTHKQVLGYQNPFYLKKTQWIKPTLYDGSVISSQHVVIHVIDDEKTLIFEEILVNVLFHNKKCLLNKLSGYKLHTLILTNVLRNLSKLKLLRNFLRTNPVMIKMLLKFQNFSKDTTISKLKEHIKSIRENDKEEKVKQDMDEIETINIELEHSVAKLLFENELLHKEIKHLKKIYKDQFDSIKKTCALSKEHYNSLIAQLNSNSMENVDLKGQNQEKVFVTKALQNELRRIK
nr:hypothetical protein [Tanacetum cinerariifolium]